MPEIKFITFDVDGTLIDSQEMIVRCLQLACRDLSIDCPPSRAQLLSGVGLPLAEAVPKAIPHIDPARISEFVTAFRVHYDVLKYQVLELMPLFPGVREMLDELRRKNYQLGIYTSKIKSGLDIVLDQHHIRDYFINIKTPDDGPGKPDPFLLNRAMAELNVMPENTIFVGDSTYDMLAGRAAGAGTLAVSWGYHTPQQLIDAGAQRVIDSVADIVPAVTQWS